MIGELHCHTNLSFPRFVHRNLPTPYQLVDHAVSIGLDFVAITDHDCQDAFAIVNEYALQKGIVLIPSVEITIKMSRLPYKRPHVLAFGVTEKIPSRKPLGVTLDRIHEQGGVAVAAHPFTTKYRRATYMGSLCSQYPFDGIEIFNGSERPRDNENSFRFAQENKFMMYGGSDAHIVDYVGKTTIDVEIPKTSDWREIVAGMRAGKFSFYKMQYNDRPASKFKGSPMYFFFTSLRGKAS